MDYYLDINGISRHGKSYQEFTGAKEGEWNEKNYGGGITVKENSLLYSLGGFKNSFGNPSYYAGVGYEKKFGDEAYVGLSALGGFVTGYEKELTPMIVPRISFGLKDLGELGIMYTPEFENNPEVWMMNLSVPIK